ncbi:LysM peptidoglycan-binding domain-containing M23 family metallopeptidase [Candidatus Rhodobacter oscarellae]|uniref:LysM peptidoglycan-binding domain-containing M23 family metallopeptidase n=1 Tax=Candidatus Rhodobacter oscarellae TaxID=1675527 RepID=UPI002E0DB269
MLGTSLFALSACSDGFDLDLRNIAGGPDTSEAVRQQTQRRPNPDDRGLISYPSFQVAVAKRGDTVADVANRIGQDPVALARYNGLDVSTQLRGGEVVALPEPADGRGTLAGLPANDAIDITTLAGDALDRADREGATGTLPPVQAGPEPIQHQVARGETAYSISRLYKVSVRALADWNGLGSDLNVREGQYLLIPIAKSAPVAPAARAPEPEVSVPGAGSIAPEPPSASTPLPEPEPEPEVKETPAPPAELAQDRTAASSTRLSMPVNGSIIRDYVKGKSDGIDISASAGTPVKAAAAGTVAAITRDTDGVPILVLRHSGNLLTVYANIEDVAFKKGDSVSKGQTIAKVRGASPSFLHFEVREGFDSVDPITYLN